MVRYHIEPTQGHRPALERRRSRSRPGRGRGTPRQPARTQPRRPVGRASSRRRCGTRSQHHVRHGTACRSPALRRRDRDPHRRGRSGSRTRSTTRSSYFEQGADRSAARALPLLLLPNAAALRATLDGGDGSEAYSRAAAAAGSIARSLPNEVRVHLARGLDRVWEAPCTKDETCHHGTALQLAVETMRDCVFGPWNPDTGRRQLIELADPVDRTLAGTADNEIHFSRLDAAIRALAPAAQAGICVSGRARELLTVLLAAHRRSLLSYDDDMDHRGTHALIAARALLTIAADGDDAPVHEHIDAYADNPALLLNLLRALSAAARGNSRTGPRPQHASGRPSSRTSSACTRQGTRRSATGTTATTHSPRSSRTQPARSPTCTASSPGTRSSGGSRSPGKPPSSSGFPWRRATRHASTTSSASCARCRRRTRRASACRG